jgi:hypothetical protein
MIEDINFIKWYSGMDEQKIRNAYERYLKEQPKPAVEQPETSAEEPTFDEPGCHNCNHHNMNHKSCNSDKICRLGSQWESVKVSPDKAIIAKQEEIEKFVYDFGNYYLQHENKFEDCVLYFKNWINSNLIGKE